MKKKIISIMLCAAMGVSLLESPPQPARSDAPITAHNIKLIIFFFTESISLFYF